MDDIKLSLDKVLSPGGNFDRRAVNAWIRELEQAEAMDNSELSVSRFHV